MVSAYCWLSMGQGWGGEAPIEKRAVRSLGLSMASKRARKRNVVLQAEEGDGPVSSSSKKHAEECQCCSQVLKCPQGHVMKGYVVREVCHVCDQCSQTHCDKCHAALNNEVSTYVCKECSICYCSNCARVELGLPRAKSAAMPVSIKPGDLFLCGPNEYGIHHVIVSRGEWEEPDPDLLEMLEVPPSSEVFACPTIESTQASVGETTWWYATTTFFSRCLLTGQIFLIADLPPGDEAYLEVALDPVQAKVLLHPFRDEDGDSTLDEDAFDEVVEKAAEESQKYGKWTAVQSVIGGLTRGAKIDKIEGASTEAQTQLLESIHKSWESRPICATVAIKCWQKYFESTCETPEEAVQEIMKYMPLWCDRTPPSFLATEMTKRGWILLDTA